MNTLSIFSDMLLYLSFYWYAMVRLLPYAKVDHWRHQCKAVAVHIV